MGRELLLAAGAAFVLGAAGGVAGERLLSGPDAPPSVGGRGTLETLPRGPVTVIAETVRLGDGFRSTHSHGGPTFNLVRSGVVVIQEAGRTRRYGAGELFFEPAGRVHAISVIDAVRLDVLRLVPRGAAPTTEVDPP